MFNQPNSWLLGAADVEFPGLFTLQDVYSGYWGGIWWTWSGSNRRPLPCHGSALPAAPQAHCAEELPFAANATKAKTIFAYRIRLVKPSCSLTSKFPHRANLRNSGKSVCWNQSASMRLGSRSHRYFYVPVLAAALIAGATAPTANAQAPASPATNAPPAGNAPVPYASLSQVNLLASQLDQTAQAAQADLTRLRIEKWKTDSNTKRSTQADVESISRNLQAAVPELTTQLRASPDNLGATFKLYRNLNALYDVFSSVVESAGAFGSKDEYQSLGNDLEALDRSRRAVADRMENLSHEKETEIGDLRTQLRNALATVNAAPPKKVVVDDTQPTPAPKKAVPKPRKTTKPATPKPAKPTQPQNQPAAQPPPSQPPQ